MMKKYFIEIEYPEGKLRARDRLILESIEKFDNCFIYETQVKALLAYFETLINNSLKSKKPMAKKVNLPCWSSWKYMYEQVGNIGITLKEIKDMPADFDEFYSKWAFPWTNKTDRDNTNY